MKKFRRSGRLVDLTNYLIHNPHQLISLTYFAERYDSAKSSISEDLAIIKEMFEARETGLLLTVAGASGGVKYIPTASLSEIKTFLTELCSKLEDPNRVLPGGYLYMMDIIGNPKWMNEIGRYFATMYANKKVDVIMTMATKGIPLAYAVATYMNVPVCIVRHEHRITEGSLVSINYVSGSTKRIQTMSLAKRSLKEGSNVLIIDDFMKAGGTIKGMINLVDEFQSHVVGIGVLVEADHVEERLVDTYTSMTRLSEVNTKEKLVKVELGNFFEKLSQIKED
ncbi:pur operon repressor [Anaerobacillus isosaccharinicus]|uniref:Pur operon repressor n=1 Tax=Anaerobacillus isosaccharinicus TaxID=1532552 RepID=A0A7S7RD01_9BACI|nr:pur operon repressor [Anaerobacillus isosaccharinicus]MBA5584133.1 pur operon repressor [Anaerobacillus isosaccharinicus]QOY37458.1 pur operon repressor [Anaerobacillus isosaccharinicus]